MRRTAATALVAGALALGLVACGGGGDDDGSGSTASTTSTTTRSPTSDGSEPTKTTASTPAADGPTTGEGSARAAIDLLVAAWIANDQVTAATIATPEAVQALFAQSADGYALYGCDTGEFDTSTCNFRNRATAGYASITAEKAPIGWVVTAAFLTTDN